MGRHLGGELAAGRSSLKQDIYYTHTKIIYNKCNNRLLLEAVAVADF
jgi:hypothetical protein